MKLLAVREDFAELFLFLTDRSYKHHVTSTIPKTAAQITLLFSTIRNILDTRLQDTSYKSTRMYRISITAPPVSPHLMLKVPLQTKCKNLRKRFCLMDHTTWIYEWPKGQEIKPVRNLSVTEINYSTRFEYSCDCT